MTNELQLSLPARHRERPCFVMAQRSLMVPNIVLEDVILDEMVVTESNPRR
ncbi:hypothetical protein HAP48_0026315 [Bradyrhizobium septentrionale]|uniref:Uncharacterized protein n=1 Tax=Bradyrhizobium septentrionale TaxID=1404411 RepID=A0A973ZYN8_9BRAD|nr:MULTISPECIES: hypothetical protein [Bradyrhizobium]UGY12247.1 hypothetical protein HAP48_0026315 [Bradyrhizobium septentrionale]UGY25635.1 hypothetical protein HU675_0001795 [Bradyrhizobium septentrionale]